MIEFQTDNKNLKLDRKWKITLNHFRNCINTNLGKKLGFASFSSIFLNCPWYLPSLKTADEGWLIQFQFQANEWWSLHTDGYLQLAGVISSANYQRRRFICELSSPPPPLSLIIIYGMVINSSLLWSPVEQKLYFTRRCGVASAATSPSLVSFSIV